MSKRKKTGLGGGPSRRRKRQRRVPKTIEQVKSRAKHCGSHYFDKGTMRFFNSRVLSKVYPASSGRCAYFVTSEKFGPGHDRRYSVRKQCGCRIDTVGEFQQYKTADRAKRAAQRKAKKR